MTLDERFTYMPGMKHVSRPAPVLLIGLGNPILGDDGVGWKVVQAVEQQLAEDSRFHIPIRPMDSKTTHRQPLIEVDYLSLGGLSLMERLIGYERVILVDSMETGQNPTGSVTVYALETLPDPTAGHSASAHDTSLLTALQTAKVLGVEIPGQVDVVAIEASQVYDFSDKLTEPIRESVPVAVRTILNLLDL